MKRKILAQKFLTFALTASVTATMFPTSAFAVTGSQVAADGTYISTAHVTRNEDAEANEDEWEEYDVEVSLTVKDGKITDIVTTPGNGYTSNDAKYVRWSTTDANRGGINTKIVGKDATVDTIISWDTVSGATCTSSAIKAAALKAIEQASEKKDEVAVDTAALESAIKSAEALTESDYTAATWSKVSEALKAAKSALTAKESQTAVDAAATALNAAVKGLVKEEKYVYCYAGLTWSEYWAAEGVQAAGSTASSDEVDAKGEYDKGAFDTVTRATKNHGLHRGSFQCNAVVETEEGKTLNLSYWKTVKGDDGKDKQIAVMTDGTEYTYNRGVFTNDSVTLNLKDYKVTGLKFVPVKVKAEDYEAFKAKYTVYENGSKLKGGYGENKLQVIDEVANVTADTNGLKTATKTADGSFSFSARATGNDSGVMSSLKKADGLEPEVKATSGSYGEFLRVDFNGNYGDLGANMQAVKWTYYGNDSTRTKALATYGTKFASDNWMHKSMGIQLGLTDSLRCSLPSGYDGTGYWSVTIYALGYEDYTYNFEATAANIVKPQVPADETSKKALSDKVAEAEKLDEALYTEKTWTDMQKELKEAREALEKTDLMQSEAKEALSHLTDAVNNLKSQYVLMNIPYDEFYKADLNNNSVKVDATTSATKQKTRNTLAAGSYHADAEGEHINGVTFPVKVTDEFYDNNKGYTQITDDSKVDITTNMKGKVSTTTYEGKKALFESADYSYYVLSEVPSYYKTATVGTDKKLSFGAVNGTKTQIASGQVKTKFKTKTKYGDYQLNLDGIKDAMSFEDDDVVYGVIVSTDDTDYAMRHVENIWKTEDLAWSVGIVTESHGCPLSSNHYKSMVGKTIKNVTYYTSKGIFTLPVEYKVLEHVKDSKANVENAAVSAGKTNFGVALPDDFDAEYAVTDAKGKKVEGFKVTEESLASATSTYAASYTQNKKLVITYPKDAENTEYTLTVSDKNKKYAPITTTFELYADTVSAAYNNDATAPKLVKAEGATDAQFADFIGKIKSVNVNDKVYPAPGKGKGAVKIIKEDGTIDTTQAPFAEGSSFEIKVSATGYKGALSFTYDKPAVIDTKALESVIEKADTLKEADYTADSWKTFSQVLSSAKAVLGQKDDQTKVDNAVKSLNKAIEGLKKKEAVNPGTPGSGTGSTGAISGGAGSSNGAGTNATVATGKKANSTTADTTGSVAKKATVKKASKTSDTNPLMGMLALAFASISLVGAALFAKKPNRK